MESPNSPPKSDSHDPGSSVSSNMMEEYEDLLRYAVVTPNFNEPVVSPTFKASLPFRSTIAKTTSPFVETSNAELFSTDEEQHDRTPRSASVTNSSNSETCNTLDIRNFGSATSKEEQVTRPVRVSTGEPSIAKDPSQYSREGDPELTRLDSLLDTWCCDLKSNVMAEFIHSKVKMRELFNKSMQTEREQHSKAIQRFSEDQQRNLDLLKTYESSLAKKDEVIASLTKSIQKQKKQVGLTKTFCVWKFHCIDKKRELFTEKMAARHYNLKLKSKLVRSWFGLIQGRWKQRVEKACQLRAEEVCHSVTDEYENKLAALHHSYDEALGEISVLKQAQSVYEENMKKAFMRGVCALNMEAMTMFNDSCVPVTTNSHYDNNNYPSSTEPTNAFQTTSSEDLMKNTTSSCKHLNVKFHKSEKRTTKKVQPSVTIERHTQ